MNGATLVAVGLSLVSAVAYASAAVAQERLAARTDAGAGLLTLLGRGAWWWSVGLNAAGALLHVVALTYGSLTVVQPLGALTLVAAVPLGAHRAGRQVTRGEWRGTALTLVGLAVILLTAAGTAPADTLTLPQALGVAGAAMALVALFTRTGGRPGLRHAAASGITSGVASALTQTVTVAATARSTNALPMWQVAGVALLVAAFAAGGLLLSQRAYQGGLGAPLAVLTLANPVAAAVIGLTLLGERLQGGAIGIVAALAGAVAAARGVVLLTRTAVAESATTAPLSDIPAGPAPGPAERAAVPLPAAPDRTASLVPLPGGRRPEAPAVPAPGADSSSIKDSLSRPSRWRDLPASRSARVGARATHPAVPGGSVWDVPTPVVLLPAAFAGQLSGSRSGPAEPAQMPDAAGPPEPGTDAGGDGPAPEPRDRRCRA
jgi:drug/metabolite transporter (DMT)-like permease